MVGRRRTTAEEVHQNAPPSPGEADLNEIVAYNFRAARELRGLTQEETAELLERFIGQRLLQASISAIERAYEGDRRREFDAQEILAFALAFDLPLLWFFLPPPGDTRRLYRTSDYVRELYGIVFGRDDKLEPVYERLRQIGIEEPTEAARTVELLTGKPSPARQASYRQRRKEMLLALLDQYTDRVDKAADELGAFFDHLRLIGVRGLVAEHLDDPDFQDPSATGKRTTTNRPKRGNRTRTEDERG